MATQLQRLHIIAIIIDRYNNNRYIIDIIIIKETLWVHKQKTGWKNWQ